MYAQLIQCYNLWRIRIWSVLQESFGKFSDYGTPKILQSDNGAEFVNKIIDAFTILHGIEPRLSAVYNPRTNGLVERRNKDISKALKKFIEGDMADGMIGCQWFRLVSIRHLAGEQVQQLLVLCSISILMD